MAYLISAFILVVAVAVQWGVWQVFWPTQGELKDGVFYAFKPDALSRYDGQYARDQSATFNLYYPLALSALIAWLAYALICVQFSAPYYVPYVGYIRA